jgi:hypothetical protein
MFTQVSQVAVKGAVQGPAANGAVACMGTAPAAGVPVARK